MVVSFRNSESEHVFQNFIGTAIQTHKQIGKLLHRDIKIISVENDGIHKTLTTLHIFKIMN